MRPFRLRVVTAIVLALLMLGSLGGVVNAAQPTAGNDPSPGLHPPTSFPEDPWPGLRVPTRSFPEDPWPGLSN